MYVNMRCLKLNAKDYLSKCLHFNSSASGLFLNSGINSVFDFNLNHSYYKFAYLNA